MLSSSDNDCTHSEDDALERNWDKCTQLGYNSGVCVLRQSSKDNALRYNQFLSDTLLISIGQYKGDTMIRDNLKHLAGVLEQFT